MGAQDRRRHEVVEQDGYSDVKKGIHVLKGNSMFYKEAAPERHVGNENVCK